MQLEKETLKKEETINLYEELFSKKEQEVESLNTDSKIESNTSIESPIESKSEEKENQSFIKNKTSIIESIKEKTSKFNLKYIVTGLLIGIIANISIYHYQSIELQNNSQKLVTGLIYNLSENNNLEQIASNIYLGMKDSGWEPTVKLSNSNTFVFELDKGAEFTITKSEDLVSTKFHVSVNNFSNAMVKALMIQLEPNKIGGTKNYINNKKYDPKNNTISFDIDKLGLGLLPSPSTPIYLPSMPLPPLPTPILPPMNNPNLDPQILTIPISPDLDRSIIKQGKNINIDPGIQINKENIKDNKTKLDVQTEKTPIK